MAPSRTVGLPIHLLYPILSAILLGVAAFPTAGSVWYISAQTNALAVSPDPFSHPVQLLPLVKADKTGPIRIARLVCPLSQVTWHITWGEVVVAILMSLVVGIT